MDKEKSYGVAQIRLSLLAKILPFIILSAILISGWSSFLDSKVMGWIAFRPLQVAVYFLLFSLTFIPFDWPLSFFSAYYVEKKYGLGRQTFLQWTWDDLKKRLFAFTLSLLLLEVLYALIKYSPQKWWLYAWVAWFLVVVFFARISHRWFLNIFYETEPLRDVNLRNAIKDLLQKNHFSVQDIRIIKLGKKTRKANAACAGWGKSRQVFLADTLIENFTHEEVTSVLAHELGHARMGHIWKGIFLQTLLSFALFFLVHHLMPILGPIMNVNESFSLAGMPLLFLLANAGIFICAPLSNAFSRKMEWEADRFALGGTSNSDIFARALEKLGKLNMSIFDPHPILEFLFYSHPSLKKRIAHARQFIVMAFLMLVLNATQAWALSDNAKRSAIEANNRGIELLREEQYDGAIRYLEKAVRLDRNNRSLRQNLAAAHTRYADELLQEEYYLAASKHLEAAIRLNPQNEKLDQLLNQVYDKIQKDGIFEEPIPLLTRTKSEKRMKKGNLDELLGKALELMSKNELEPASILLQDLLKAAPKNGMAWELLGDVAYRSQVLDQAQGAYQNAMKYKPTEHLKKKLEKLSREMTVETDMDQYEEEHFIIRYRRSFEEYGQGSEIRQMLRDAWKAISQDLGFYPAEKVVVILYSEEEYRDVTESADWAAAHFDGKIRIPVYGKGLAADRLSVLIYHELTHYFIQRLAKGRAPDWMNEGIAQIQESKITPAGTQFLEQAFVSDSLLSWKEMDTNLKPNDKKANEDIYLFYQQAFAMTSFLIERFHMFEFKRYLETLAGGSQHEEAFRSVFMTDPDQFFQEWKEVWRARI